MQITNVELNSRLQDSLPRNIYDISVAELKVQLLRAFLNGRKDIYMLKDLNEELNKLLTEMLMKFGISASETMNAGGTSWSCNKNGIGLYFNKLPCDSSGKPSLGDIFYLIGTTKNYKIKQPS
jgi:hypothetical protein